MEQLEIQSSKIKCGGCVANIEKGLTGFSGIDEVKVEIESNVVSIKGNKLNEEAIKTKLAELGYPAV